jgi:ribosomal-protein-alanine N-acetyltransferase
MHQRRETNMTSTHDLTRTTPPDGVEFLPLPLPILELLIAGDLQAASAGTGAALPAFFLDETWLWTIRRDQILQSPDAAPWLVRAVWDPLHESVVGHAGFHGPPDSTGMVEVAYTVIPELRGKGLGHRILASLLAEAWQQPRVRTVRATISPQNLPSLAVARRSGLRHVGDQWDDEDGLELVFELEKPLTV